MAPKQQPRLAALRKKLKIAVGRWVRAKDVVIKYRFKLRCAEQARKNLKRVVDDKRNKLLLEYPEEDISDLLDGEEFGTSDLSSDHSS
jgi:tRNA A58 N-methylase Trm61